MKYRCYFLILSFWLFALSPALTQEHAAILKSMGLEKDAKLLIIHADDLGVSNSVNQASIKAFESGIINSASIMVPCPWFPEIAAYARQHPEVCWGIHLTLTAEWKHYKWRGVSSSEKITSVLNEDLFMYPAVADVLNQYNIDEVEIELRAQIERAQKYGIQLSHLDSHMGTLFSNEELLRLYLKLGKEYGLPCLLPKALVPPDWNLEGVLGQQQIDVNQVLMLNGFPESWLGKYKELVDNIVPGINELIVHLAFDNSESQGMTVQHSAFGAAWRQNDLDVLKNPEFRAYLKSKDIHLVSWKELSKYQN